MRQLRALLFRLAGLFHKDRRDRDLAAEMDSHLRMHIEDNLRAGMNSAEARRQALMKLGGVEQTKETVRDRRALPLLESLLQDLRYGLRMLLKDPGFTFVAVLTLALGIGANTTIFSVIESALWRPLPFPHSERLVDIASSNLKRTWEWGPVSPADFLDWKSHGPDFGELTAFEWDDKHTLTGGEAAERVSVMPVATNFYDTLQVAPRLGRTFTPDEDRPGKNHVALLSHGLWERHFNSDSGIIGKTFIMDGAPYTVVGVLSAGHHLDFTHDPDLYVPLTIDAKAAANRARRVLSIIGRLKPGVSFAQAQVEMTAIAQSLAKQHPQDDGDWGARVQNLREVYTGYASSRLYVLFGAVVLVLIIACANVANLLLFRGLTRQREFAVRSALGASRRMLIRQLLAESVLLAVPALLLGTLLANWGVRIFTALLPPGGLPREGRIVFDTSVFVFAIALSLTTAVLFGLVPALFSSRVDLNTSLKGSSQYFGGGGSEGRARHAFVVAQVGMALVLLFGAGLFTNSFLRLERVRLGFDPRHVLTVRLSLTGPKYAAPQQIVTFYQRSLERLQSLPGIRTATAADEVPLTSGQSINFAVAGRPLPSNGQEPNALVRIVTPGYFEALKIPLLAGRSFDAKDSDTAPRVAIINENFARHVFPGEDPLGKQLLILPGGWDKVVKREPVQIVGLAANVREVGLNEVAFDDIYFPFSQNPDPSMFLVLNTGILPATLATSVRQEIAALDKDLPISTIVLMEQRVADALQSDRFNLLLIGTFAGLGVLLASVGIYGAMAYLIEQRTREFGIRIALGAGRQRILSLTLGQAASLTVIGLSLGLAVSLALGRMLQNRLYLVEHEHEGLLYGVSVFDPLTLALACALLAGVALLACYVPARRATRVDPIVALRYE